MSNLKQVHPLYTDREVDWEMLRDAYDGESRVKEQGTKYLPATAGQVLDGMSTVTQVGYMAYDAYKTRAVFPDFMTVGVETLIGILNAKETVIELPPQMEYLRKRATLNNEGLAAVIRKIHTEQLVTGRAGILAELPEKPDPAAPEQYIVIYKAESILNWDNGSFNDGFDKLNMVLLDESGYERMNIFEWKKQSKYRALSLGLLGQNEALGTYRQGEFNDTTASVADVTLIEPMIRGKTLNEIPFVFVGGKDLVPDPDVPPLLGLARLCMTIYRGEADYRQSLYMQGQETLVVIGGVRVTSTENPDDALRVGAGARVDVEMNGDAKYIGIKSSGLPEQRMALEADRNQAAVRTGQLLAPGKMSMESGEALKTRVAAQTATLTSVAITAAAALEQLLRTMATWQGADPDKVKVIPNLDFTNVAIAGQDIVQLVTAKNLGFPISYKTLHDVASERGLTKSTFDEEIALIEKDPKVLTDIATALVTPPQANNAIESAGGPKKKPDVAPVKSNAPKK